MKNLNIYIVGLLILAMSNQAIAGNKDRAGQMGATELNINPWAMTSALFYGNGAYVRGMEAMKLNVAGLARQKGLEVGVSYNNYIMGTDISFVNGAFAMDIGEDNKLGVNIMSFNFGNPYLATVENPEQELTFSPSFVNIGLAFSHEFSEDVAAGIQATVVNESIGQARASGVSIDAGIQYNGGTNNNTHFGVSLRNVGPTFSFSGDGFNQSALDENGNPTTVQTPSGKINLPTQFMISASYDVYPGHSSNEEFNTDSAKYVLRPMFTFTSNAYYADHLTAGVEFLMNQKFALRTAYRYEQNIFNNNNAQTFFSGLSAGLGLNFFLDREERTQPLTLDYAYRMTRISGGVHSISLKFVMD